MKQIEDYLGSKGWAFKFRNGEYCLDLCPLCNATPGHFYINAEKEIFYCHKCGERGHILSLKKRLGDLPPISHASQYSKSSKPEKKIDLTLIEKYHKDFLENPAIAAYLTDERRFTLETIKKFKLGFHEGAITIPYMKEGQCVNIKYRPIKPENKKYFREEGCPSILFNLDNARKYQGIVIITEGEFDAIAFDQMGFPNVVSVPNGAEAFSDQWIDDLEQFNEIYISFDMDEAGRKGVEKAADKLGRYRCLNVLLPLKDANDCLRAGFLNAEMAGILAQAKPFGSRIIKGPEAFFDDIRDFHSGKLESHGIPTGWKDFDDLFQGFRPNELTILTGETGSGKTTWASNLAFKLSESQHPTLIASFEMKPPNILRKMVQMKSRRSVSELNKRDLEAALEYISTLPVHFIDVYGEIGLQELKDAIYYAKRQYGIELVILDHLHFFLKYSGDHERQAIDSAVRDIKRWAMELGIHMVLIVHPTKIETENREIRLNDLKGSSGLKQIPNNVLSIWRQRGKNDSKSPTGEVVLYVLKCRDDLGDEGVTDLIFDKRSQNYRDSDHGGASPSEGKGFSRPSPSVRPGRDWANGYDS